MAESKDVSVMIDTNLYSRQIGTFGMETMGKLIQMKVLISGLRGLGVEIAKNLILAGPAAVTLHDDSLVELGDLGSNFYLSVADVGKKSRAQACANRLAELNPYVKVTVHSGPISADVISNLSVAVFTGATEANLLEYNELCRTRTPAVGFICADSFGLVGRAFVDYGDSFTVRDQDGEEPRNAIIAGITQEKLGIVHTHEQRRHGFQDGDHVAFKEVEGMTELNGSVPRPIKVTGPYSFTIEDTTGYKPYIREGIVTQVKVPKTIAFSSYKQSLTQPGELPTPDLAKFGRSEQLHIALQALQKYRAQNSSLPAVRNISDGDVCVKLAKELNASLKTQDGAALTVDEVDETVVRQLAFFSKCSFSPMCAFLGGVVAQEIVKFTGKFTPLQQPLYYDMFELLPAELPTDWQPIGSRHDEQVAIFGKALQDRLGNMQTFLVGAGALGCEYLKSMSMMGACCGPQGKVTVTDMDRIETSNLNRQFLFRQSDVGHPKSSAAARAAKAMNNRLNVSAMEVRVGGDTEDTFDDQFWGDLDVVINALDNIQARLYVDSRCVWFSKPLLESGTLGTKANVQVVLPYLTQSYGDSQDPPEESIPLCTLKHFPHAIEHTIEWGREFFEQLFVEGPREVNTFLGDTPAYLAKLPSEGTGTSQLAKIAALRKVLDGRDGGSFETCVKFAVLEFQDKFHHSVAQLLHTFPAEHKTSDGSLFWSGPKRQPSILQFDPCDDVHLEFVVSAANLYAANLGIPACRDKSAIAKMAKSVLLSAFAPKDVKIKVDDKDTTQEGCVDDDDKARQQIKELNAMGKTFSTMKGLEPAEFEKDDDTNFHIAFVTAAANLRARNYKIPEADFHKVKMTAGKIIPAIATTTAMVIGLASCELLKVLTLKDRKVEDFKNAFVTLALPLWVMSEPLPPLQTKSKDYDPIVMGPVKARPEGFTSWDKVEINKGDITLQEFVDFLQDEMGVEVSIMSAGNACLYQGYSPAHRKRLGQKVTQIWQDVTKQTLSPKKKYLILEVCAADFDDGIDVQIPSIKFQFK